MSTSRQRRSSRGTLYVVTLACATIVTLVGVSGLLTLRVWQRSLLSGGDVFAARSYAQSAVELGRYLMVADPNWRVDLTNGTWIAETAFDRGSLALRGVDRLDSNLADSEAEEVELTGTGRCGSANFHLRVTLVSPASPLDALRACLHAHGDISIGATMTVVMRGGPLSSNGTITSLGTIRGDVEANQVVTMTPVQGTTTEPAPRKKRPAADIFSQYAALAVVIPYSAALERGVLAPGENPWGAESPDGVYRINTGGSGLIIRGLRLSGTLLVDAGAGMVTIGPDVLLAPARADYPTLIIKGNVTLDFSSHSSLREADWTVNLNPATAPFNGRSDGDTNDHYDTEIRGLAHVIGNVTVLQHVHVRGVIVAEGTATINGTLEVQHDPELFAAPPMHYLQYSVPAPTPRSFRQVLDPNS